jgi:hypothetical protein
MTVATSGTIPHFHLTEHEVIQTLEKMRTFLTKLVTFFNEAGSHDEKYYAQKYKEVETLIRVSVREFSWLIGEQYRMLLCNRPLTSFSLSLSLSLLIALPSCSLRNELMIFVFSEKTASSPEASGP